jgi:hypothetical protein
MIRQPPHPSSPKQPSTPHATPPPCPSAHPSATHHHHAPRRSFAAQVTSTAVALHSAHTVIDATTGEYFEHAQLIRGANKDEWLYSTTNEFGRLTKWLHPHMPTGTETMRYLRHDKLPPGCNATYARFVATERPHKTETKRLRLAIRVNPINYPIKVSTPTADISTINILLNSVISTRSANILAPR